MSKWIVENCKDNIELNNPILIEGLPGIGNIGKLALDFIVDELEPELIYKIHSFNFPPSVLVNDNNLISLPCVNIYRLERDDRDILLLTGDFQPLQEEASYHFSEEVLNLAKKIGCSEIITLGGIGLNKSPENIKVFGTATDKETLNKYEGISDINFNISGKVGAIFGATGLLLGLAPLHKINGIGLLVETTSSLEHVASEETKVMLKTLKEVFGFDLDLERFESEMEKLEEKKGSGEKGVEKELIKKFKEQANKEDLNYIG